MSGRHLGKRAFASSGVSNSEILATARILPATKSSHSLRPCPANEAYFPATDLAPTKTSQRQSLSAHLPSMILAVARRACF